MTRQASFADLVGDSAGSGQGFFGFDRENTAAGASLAIFGAETATPYPSAGAYCADAPKVLRKASRAMAGTVSNMHFDLKGAMLPTGVTAVDLGDLPIVADRAEANRAVIEKTTRAVVALGAVPVIIGGDDSVPIPFAAGLDNFPQLSILQIDAHIDWRDTMAGETLGLSSPMRRISEMAHSTSIVQVGRRGAGSATASDVADAEAYGVRFEGARGLDGAAIARALNALPPGGDVLVCLDVDAFDPAIVPAVIGRTPGGLSYWQMVDLLDGCAARCRIAGFALTEFMPSADINGLGALTTTRILAHAIGLIARQKVLAAKSTEVQP